MYGHMTASTVSITLTWGLNGELKTFNKQGVVRDCSSGFSRHAPGA